MGHARGDFVDRRILTFNLERWNMNWTSVERMALADEIERTLHAGLDIDLHILALDLVDLMERFALPADDSTPLFSRHTEAAANVFRSEVCPPSPDLEVRVWEASGDARVGREVRVDGGEWEELEEKERCADWTIYHINL